MMRKKARSSQQKEDGPVLNSNDFISQMPDVILHNILSRLPLKDATLTSILSTRWKYVWCHLISLDFDATEISNKITMDPKLHDLVRSKLINWVNCVIHQHKALNLEGLRICLGLDKSSKNAIDKWIQFAMSKGVQKLDINLIEKSMTLSQIARNYVFPVKLFGRSLGKLWSSVPSTHSSEVTEMKFLTILRLKSVNVGDEAFGKILTYCPALEELAICWSADLVNVKISGRLKLKCIEIMYCFGMESIEMYDVNLSFFCYTGAPISLKLNNLPMLNEIYIGQGRSGISNSVFDQLSCLISNLQCLTLFIPHPEERIKLVSIPQLPKLQEMTLKVGAWDDESLLDFTSLAQACPNLCTFTLQLMWFSTVKRRRKIRHVANHPHRRLKVLEIEGYLGRISDVELIVYFIENAASLQRITIDCHPVDGFSNKTNITENEARSAAKQQLEPITPEGVKLVIL